MTSVLIVGAGPTGLTLAIELARRGVAFRLIDRYAAPLGWDRATVVKARTLEIADMMGLADAFMARGRIVERVNLFSEGELAASIGFDRLDSSFPHMLSLPESETEAILTEELERLGGSVERGVELTALEQNPDGARACLRRSVDRDEQVEVVAADWIVGTDGLHSTVRQAVGDAFEGHDNPRLWGVVDGYLDGWKHADTHIAAILQMPSANPIPLNDGRWRIYFRPEVRDLSALEGVVGGLQTMSPGTTLRDRDEPRFFHTHSRVARAYRVDRVLVAGDAAHACSPIQGHGMNCGIQDSHNLGWKLAAVVKGDAPAGLLDTYVAERRPVAELVVQSSDKAEAMSVRQDPDERAGLIAFLADPNNNQEAAINEAEIAHRYAPSAIVGPGGGFRARDVGPLITPKGETRLYELLRDGRHHLLVFDQDGDGLPQHAIDAARPFARHVEVHRVVERHTGDTTLGDPSGALRGLSSEDAKVGLLRPDGYIAAAGPARSGLESVRMSLEATFGRSA